MANARLIAAAPALLAACELALTALQNCQPHPGYGAARAADMSILRAAIARATLPP